MCRIVYKILIVDDEPRAREKIAALLRSGLEQQVEIVEASTIDDAKSRLTNISDRGFDLVIIDWLIDDPNADGSANATGDSLLKWMQDPHNNVDAEAIMLTAHVSTQIEQTVLDLGAYAYADKPSVIGGAMARQSDGTRGGSHSKTFLFHVRNCVQRRFRRWRTEQVLRVLQKLHRKLADIHDVEKRLCAIVEYSLQLNMYVSKASIRVRFRDKHQRVAIFGGDPNAVASATLPIDQGIVGHVFSTSEAYWCKDTATDPYYIQTWDKTRSELCVPVFGPAKPGATNVVAVINVESDVTDAFDRDDAENFQLLAEVASLTIQDTQLFQHIFDMVIDINSCAHPGSMPGPTRSTGIETYLEAVAKVPPIHVQPLFIKLLAGALSFTSADAGAVFLADRRNNLLRQVAEQGMGEISKEKWQSIPFNHEKSIVARVFKSKSTILATGLEKDASCWEQYGSFFDSQTSRGSFLCVPICLGPEIIGVIDLESRNALTFSPLAAKVIEAYARMAATAIANLALMVSIKSETIAQTMAGLIVLAIHEVLGPLHKVESEIGRCESLLAENRIKALENALADASRIARVASQSVVKLLHQSNENYPEPFDLCALLSSVVDSECLAEPDFPIEFNEDADFFVRGSASATRFVVRELLVNARKHASGGGAGSTKVTIYFDLTDDRFAKIWFKDNGPGIPSQKAEQLFQAPSADDGHGYGLHRCQAVMRLYGGDLVHVNCGTGAAFCLYFPRFPEKTK